MSRGLLPAFNGNGSLTFFFSPFTQTSPSFKMGDVCDISFDLYKEGKSIKEIAAERGCTVITIEGHLAQFVAKGELDVSLFVDPAKVAVILELAKELDTMNLGPYKERLGSDYSYEEIRFAMAHRLSMAK